jgi:hypothetical protein
VRAKGQCVAQTQEGRAAPVQRQRNALPPFITGFYQPGSTFAFCLFLLPVFLPGEASGKKPKHFAKQFCKTKFVRLAANVLKIFCFALLLASYCEMISSGTAPKRQRSEVAPPLLFSELRS